MALVKPSPRPSADATRRGDRVRRAEVVPLEQRPGAPAARVGEGTRRERVRMELLVERARAPTAASGQPPMCDISTLGRSTGVLAERSSE